MRRLRPAGGYLFLACFGKIRDEKIFLIKKNSEVVVQLMVSESFLSEGDNPLRKFMDFDGIRRYLAKKTNAFQSSFIGDTRFG